MEKIDKATIAEWVESLEDVKQIFGYDGIKEILQLFDKFVDQDQTKAENRLNTDYINTITRSNQKKYPGNIELEEKIENIIRWNAAAMVLKGVDNNSNVGGHIATYSSASTILEIGFNHFFPFPSCNFFSFSFMMERAGGTRLMMKK